MDRLKDLAAFAAPGSVWLVGGVLRDAFLKRPLGDVDLAVKGDARALAAAFAGKLKCPFFPLDEERGVYRVVHAGDGGRTYDFAAIQGDSIAVDLARRDFTVNAMALSLEDYLSVGLSAKGLLDPFGGRKDLKSRRMRAIGEKAFKDDPLRLLRAVRQAAELDFTIEPKTAGFVKKHAKLILNPAPERVREELLKTLSTPRAAAAFRFMDKTGLLTALFPEGEEMRRSARDYYGKEGVLGHSLDAMASLERMLEELPFLFPDFHKPLKAHLTEPVSGHPRYALLKLGELFHDAGKPATLTKDADGKLHFYGHEHAGAKIAEAAAARWRLSGDEGRSLTRLVRGHMRPGSLGNAPKLTDKAIYRFYRDLEGDAVALLVMALGDHFTYLSEKVRRGRKDPVYRAIRRMLENFYLRPQSVAPSRLLDGNALMRKFKLKPGPLIGDLLDAVREAQAAGKVKNVEEAFALAARLVKKAG
jgi:tRNA nucleotidyltransferase/poly(A) polymerase